MNKRNVYKQRKRKADRKFLVPNGTDTVVDENGVVIYEKEKFKEVKVKQKSRYATMFLDDDNVYEALKGLGNAGAIWGFVLIKYDKDNNVFHFSGSVKEQCKKVTGLSDGTVRSAIAGFCESGLLLKIRNAEYMVNPNFFYMGNWDLRDEVREQYEELRLAKEKIETKGRFDAKTVDV